MADTKKAQLRVFWQLIKRDAYVLKQRVGSRIIDASINVATSILVFGSLLPLMGMPSTMIGPTFIGSILQLIFSIGYGLSLRVIFDVENTHFINYHLTLPINYMYVLGVYIVNFIVEVSIICLPLFFVGIIALGTNFSTLQPDIPLFFCIYLASLLLIAIMFLGFSLSYPFRWFFDNIWPRRLNPLFLLSSVFFPWKKVYALSKLVGIVLLCNPFTYVAEGFRSTLIGGPDFLHPVLCICMVLISSSASFAFFATTIKKRLDPV